MIGLRLGASMRRSDLLFSVALQVLRRALIVGCAMLACGAALAGPLPVFGNEGNAYFLDVSLVWLDLGFVQAFDNGSALLLGASKPFAGYRYSVATEAVSVSSAARTVGFTAPDSDPSIVYLVDLLQPIPQSHHAFLSDPNRGQLKLSAGLKSADLFSFGGSDEISTAEGAAFLPVPGGASDSGVPADLAAVDAIKPAPLPDSLLLLTGAMACFEALRRCRSSRAPGRHSAAAAAPVRAAESAWRSFLGKPPSGRSI